MHFANRPTRQEIIAAIRKLKNGKSGGDARVPAEFFKVLLRATGSRCLDYLMSMYNEFWETGSFSGDVDELAEDNDGREDEDIPHAPSDWRSPKHHGRGMKRTGHQRHLVKQWQTDGTARGGSTTRKMTSTKVT